MSNLHIAFFTNQTKAHTFATQAIASILLQRGHRVTYATTESLGPDITRLGAEAITYTPFDGKASIGEDWLLANRVNPNDPKNIERFFYVLASSCLNHTAIELSQISGFYECNKPDVILYDSDVWAGRILAGMWKVPAIQIFSYFALYNGFYSKENCAWCEPLPSDELCEKLNIFFPLIFPIADLNIYFMPREFQPNEHRFDERFFFSWPCFSRNSLQDMQKNRSVGNKSVLLVSISASTSALISDINYFKLFISAFAKTRWKVILSTGDKIDSTSLGPIPPNFEISQHTPQRELLPSASVFIGSGGAVSTLEALYYGIPLILIPQDYLHAEFAHRVVQLGLGVVLKKADLTGEIIESAVAKVSTDTAMLDRVRAMQQKIVGANGAESIADKIEKYLELGNATA